MKLFHKNMLYTSIVTGILTVLVLGYFILMLPSLYVDYISNENYNSIVEQHNGYLKDGSYKNVSVKNPACMTIEVPFDKDSFTLTGKFFNMRVTPSTDEMKNLILDIKSFVKTNIKEFKNNKNTASKELFKSKLNEKATVWKEAFQKQLTFMDKLPFKIETQPMMTYSKYYGDNSMKMHYLSDNTIIMESGASDGQNHYTNYVGFTYDKDSIVISYLPTMTPQMNEIRPIVIHSLPMLIAVIVLFALVVSYLYSRGIVDPIIRLVKHTEAVKRSGRMEQVALTVTGNDEIAMLINTLNELYAELNKNYNELESKNAELKEKSKRQEVFLRSSSHQLKTPIAAALLLTDGMINKIGKYQDVDKYLPEVKKQLLSMKKIVEDVLYLSRSEQGIRLEMVDLNMFVEGQLRYYQIALTEGNYNVVLHYTKDCNVMTDSNILSKILDNVISNSINHSKKGATITISTDTNEIRVHNSDAHIDEEIMPNIFEPFVSGHGKGHGLGLYIVNYFANAIGAKIEVCNQEDGVLTKVIFHS